MGNAAGIQFAGRIHKYRSATVCILPQPESPKLKYVFFVGTTNTNK